jgi:DNA-binding NtrC family response regulator
MRFLGDFHRLPQGEIGDAVIISCAMQQLKSRILLVDDRASILFTYQIILQQQGHHVTGAASYSEAVEHLDSGDFDLLLCDYGLEDGFSGFDVIDYARKKSPHIRTLLLTGFGAEQVTAEAEQRGVKVLFKPVGVRELLSTIAEWHAHRAIA